MLLLVTGSIVCVNIRGMLLGYYGFYHTKQDAGNNKLYNSLSFVDDYRPYNLFLTYSGLETGYGFFAPNVASDFIVDLEGQDSLGRPVDMAPLFKTKEGFLRMNTASSMFMYHATKDSSAYEHEKCRIFLKGIAMRLMERDRSISRITARVFLYHHPLLGDINTLRQTKPAYILYETANFSNAIIGAW
jgi:hypothetical protein